MSNSTPTPIAVWKEEYRIGDARIDREHQVLFEMFHELHLELQTTVRRDVLKSMLLNISSHTIEHFQNEEALMQARGYPGLERHQHIHANLLKKVSKIIGKFDQVADFTPDEQLTEFLHEWLAHHIRGEDQTMIHFFRSLATASA